MSNLLFVSNSFDDYILTNISDLCLDISIENIINEAKDKGIDVVKCLRQYVSVQEVGV